MANQLTLHVIALLTASILVLGLCAMVTGSRLSIGFGNGYLLIESTDERL